MANFSSIKFNGVDYPLKDATARDNIASLQTSVSGLDTRVTALEESGVQILSLDPETFDDTGTEVYSNTEIDFSKPIYLQIQAPAPDNEKQNVLQYASIDGSFEFLSQYMSFDERGAEGEKIRYLDMVSTAGDVVGFRVETIYGSNNLVISYPEVFYSSINNTVHTYPLPTEDDFEGFFDAGAPDSGRAYHISDELYYDLMNDNVTVLFTGSIRNFVSGAQLASNKKQGRFTLILDSGQVLEFWTKDLSDYGYGKCLCYDYDYVYGDNGLYNESAKFDTVKTRLDSSGKVVAVGFGKYPVKSISDGFSKVSGNSLESLTLDNYDYSKGYFNGSFTYEGMTIKSQPIQGFTSLPDGPKWYGYFTSTTGDILYVDSTYSEEQGGVMVTTAQAIPSGYYEVADIDALHALIIQKGKNLPIDKPYHFTTTFTYDYSDIYEVLHQVTFLPQSTSLMLDPDAHEEDGVYTFSIYSSENKKYRVSIDGSGWIETLEEFIETNVALPPESAFEPYKLRNIRVNGEIGIITDATGETETILIDQGDWEKYEIVTQNGSVKSIKNIYNDIPYIVSVVATGSHEETSVPAGYIKIINNRQVNIDCNNNYYNDITVIATLSDGTKVTTVVPYYYADFSSCIGISKYITAEEQIIGRITVFGQGV